MNDLTMIFQFVWQAIWHALPYFLISIFLAVLVNQLKLEGTIRRVFDNRIGIAIVLATVVGAFSPFCSCTVIPVIAGLLASGVPLAPVMSFWVASPTMDPEIFALTVGILGWPIAVVRLMATLLLSLGAGYATLVLSRAGVLAWRKEKEEVIEEMSLSVEKTNTSAALSTSVSCCPPTSSIPVAIQTSGLALESIPVAAPAATSCETGSCSIPLTVSAKEESWQTQLVTSFRNIDQSRFLHEVGKESWNIGRWLIIAFLLEALITLYVPQGTIAAVLGNSNNLAVPLAAVIGIPLYLTNITALPIINGLLAQGMQPGAAIAFLIAGPVTTIPAMTAVWGVVNRRIFVLYLAVGLLGAMLLGILANWIL